MKLYALAVCAAFVAMPAAGLTAFAQQAPGPGADALAVQLPPLTITPDMPDAKLGATLDAWLNGQTDKALFNGVVLVSHDGHEVFAKAYGPADRATARAATPDTPFNIASIGKVITRTAIAQLVDAGKLSPEDPVAKWLPNYPQATTKTATIEQLLGHRAGVADFFGPKFTEAPKGQFSSNHAYYSFVSQQPALFAPGQREQYCNGCYVVLGEIIEKASGVSYEDYVRANIFSKAGMKHASFVAPESAAKMYNRSQPGSKLQDVSSSRGTGGSAAGGSFATVRDLFAFDEALRTHKLASPTGTALVMRNAAPVSGRAMGRISIAGGTPGASALLAGQGEWTVAVVANLDPPTAVAVGNAIFSLLAGPARPRG